MTVHDLTRPSPNYNSAKPAGGRVIIHATRSGVSNNPSEFAGTLNYMATVGTTSSHFVIGRVDGQIARVVADTLQAWHAQEDNALAWGIELCQGVESDGFTAVQMDQLVEVAKHYVALGVPPVHVDGTDKLGFVGHQETVQGRRNGKSDPGSKFPWADFIRRISEPATKEVEMTKLVQAKGTGNFYALGLAGKRYISTNEEKDAYKAAFGPAVPVEDADIAAVPVVGGPAGGGGLSYADTVKASREALKKGGG